MLPADQAKELFRHWKRHYGSESNLDELLATMHKNLSAAGWKPWEWIDEDLYRLEEKYWTKEQAPCSAFRVSRIWVAVEAVLVGQLQNMGKKKKLPFFTPIMVSDWLTAHSGHEFPIFGNRNKHKAKLKTIIRGLRELAKAGFLKEVGSNRKKTLGKDCVFRRSKVMPNLLKNKWVTEQEDNRRETHNAGNTEEGAGFIIAQPQPETTENQTMAENKSPNPVSSPTSGRTTEPEDGVPDAASNQIKPDQIEPERLAEAVTTELYPIVWTKKCEN